MRPVGREVKTDVEVSGRVAEIQRVAARLFAERGFDATPVRAIAEAVGVTCPTLYYHFGSKEGLAQAILIRPLWEMVERLERLAEPGSDAVERLVCAVDVYLDFARSDPDRSRFLWAVCFGPLGRSLAAEVDRSFVTLTARFQEVVDELARSGIVAQERAGDLGRSLRGQIILHVKEFLYRGVVLERGLARKMVESTLCGYLSLEGRREREKRKGALWRSKSASR